MTEFANILRERADALGISHAALAERAGLTARAFSHYVTGQREPGLAALLRIAETVGATPNELLGVSEIAEMDAERDMLIQRIIAACGAMNEDELAVVDAVVQALVQQLAVRKQE